MLDTTMILASFRSRLAAVPALLKRKFLLKLPARAEGGSELHLNKQTPDQPPPAADMLIATTLAQGKYKVPQ